MADSFRPGGVAPISLAPVLKTSTGTHVADVTPAPAPNVAYLVGSDLNEQIVHDPRAPLYNKGATDCEALRVTRATDYTRIHVTRNYFRQPFRHELDQFDCLLNLVTDADQHPRVLRNMARMLVGVRGRVINHPAAVLRSTRDEVARRTAALADVHTPRTVRVTASNPRVVRLALAKVEFAFPALVRIPGTHAGQFVGLFDDVDALTAALEPKREYLITEFVDYRSRDGLYRKSRVFCFGERIVLRHMLVADHWNIHAANGNAFMLGRPGVLAEEERLFANPCAAFPPAVMETLHAIRRAVGLDFTGIDFAFTAAGELLLFEANATMNFFPFLEDPRVSYRKRCLEPAQQAFEAMLGPVDAAGR